MATISSGKGGPLVANVGNLTYNGYPFPVEHYVKISSRHVYDKAERAVIYTVHKLTVTATIAEYISGNSTEDQLLADIRTRLSKPGQSLMLQGHGFNDLIVNVPGQKGNIQDVAWGPKPRILTWESLGPHAADITWECEVAIPEATSTSTGQVMAYNYSAQFSIDRQGYTTRTVSGYIEIPMTRVNGGTTLPDCVDIYYEVAWPKIPFGFRRTSNQRQVSEDKRTLTFTLVDEELPSQNYLPPGVVECQASHTIDSSSRSFILYTGTISASYVLQPRAKKIDSFALFLQLVAIRIQTQKAAARTPIFCYPLSLHMAEPDIYGRAAGNYQLKYGFIVGGATDKKAPPSIYQLQNIIPSSGLFTPVGTDYERWAASVNQRVMSPRGNAQLGLGKLDDGIVSLADGDNIITPGSGPSSAHTAPMGLIAQAMQVQTPPPETSYLYYSQHGEILTEPNVVHNFFCPTSADQLSFPPAPSGVNATKASVAAMSGTAAPTSSIFQYRAATACRVRITGRALRIGYKIPPPTITTLGGAPAVYGGGNFRCWTAANFGVPLYGAQWDLYYFAGAITDKDLDDLPNPYTGTNLDNKGTL